MATTTITALTAGTALADTEVSPFDQSGATVKITSAQLKTWTSDSPTLVTPNLGVATATSINKVALTAPATGSTLTIADGVTLTVSANTTLSGTPATPGMVKIAKVVTTGSQSTITFSTISGSYTDLYITLAGRCTASGTGSAVMWIGFNGDTTSGNYSNTQSIQVNNGSSSGNNDASSSAGAICGFIPGTSGNANAMGWAKITIPNYSGATFYKGFGFESGEFFSSLVYAGGSNVWKSASAITDIVITAGATAFQDGTTAVLYGMG